MKLQPTVYIVDDDAVSRTLMKLAVEEAGLHADAFESAEGFLASFNPTCPGCILLDVQMPGMGGVKLQAKLAEMGAHIPILFVSGSADVPTAVGVIKHGAMDLIQKPIEPHSLIAGVRQCLELDTVTRASEESNARVLELLSSLTPREREVMDLVVAGLANKQIACRLAVAEKTVEVHRGRVMQKMQVDSVAQLVRLAVSAQFCKTPPGVKLPSDSGRCTGGVPADAPRCSLEPGAGTAVPGVPPAINVGDFLKRCLNHRAIAGSILEMFQSTAQELLDQIKQSLEASNRQAAEHHAHALKGAAANISAEALCAEATEFERLCSAGDDATARSRLSLLELELDRCTTSIHQVQDSLRQCA